jgi:hypothetical protein
LTVLLLVFAKVALLLQWESHCRRRWGGVLVQLTPNIRFVRWHRLAFTPMAPVHTVVTWSLGPMEIYTGPH